MVFYTVLRERAPGRFDVVKETIDAVEDGVVVSYDFRLSMSAPGVVVGARSSEYTDLFGSVEEGMVRV